MVSIPLVVFKPNQQTGNIAIQLRNTRAYSFQYFINSIVEYTFFVHKKNVLKIYMNLNKKLKKKNNCILLEKLNLILHLTSSE